MLKIVNNKLVENKGFALIEDHYCCSLPENVKDFLQNYNGDIVNGEYGIELEFATFNNKHVMTDGFCTVLHTTEIIEQLEFIGYLDDFFEESGLDRKEVEVESLLPVIAADGGGLNIYVAISGAHLNKLFVVDNGDFGICKTRYTLKDLMPQ